MTFEGCFGWLHTGTGERGVILCSPLGHEAVATHRGWRQLAEALAQQGLHVLRFDYHGSGDSEGDDADRDSVTLWQGNIRAASALLKRRCGIQAVTLVGLRFGAALAMLAANDIPEADTLALLAPVISGRTYLREMRLLARIWHEQALGKTLASGGDGSLEVTGTRYTADTVREINTVDLRTAAVNARRVLVMDAGERLETRQLMDRLLCSGVSVDRLPFMGEAEFLTEPVTSRIPYDSFSHLTAWIGRACPPSLPTFRAPPDEAPQLVFAGGRETPLRFGRDEGLFGMLCRPAQPIAGAPIVIMVNTGRTRHTGDARFYVTLARDLAKCGIASLRMDVAGLGDSDADPSVGEMVLHDPRACRDVSTAIDKLESLGWSEASVIGICSGAFIAFHTALRDKRVVRADLINQQRFTLQPENAVPPAEAPPRRRPAAFYARSLLRPYAWRAVIGGRVDVVGVAVGVMRPMLERHLRTMGRTIEAATGVETGAGAVHRCFRQLAERRVQVKLWYGDDDPGWPELEAWFGHAGRELRRFRGVELQNLPDTDHALHGSGARARLTALLCREMAPADPSTTPSPPDGDAAHRHERAHATSTMSS